MKTPREILLERHRAAAPRLDHMRRAVVEKIHNQGTRQRSSILVSLFLRGSNTLWRELIRPSRRTWAGIAAAWVVIVVVNLHDTRDTKMAGNSFTPISPAVLMAMREPDRWFSEFAEPHETLAADRPKQAVPKPRSEWHSGLFQT